MNEQESWWAGEAGNSYTHRNRVDWRARIPFWHDIMKFTGARSVYEVGCGAGWNLSAIREASPHRVDLSGCEINPHAARQARYAGFRDTIYEASAEQGQAFGAIELVFSAGMLIHIAPDRLEKMMRLIIDTSSHYVLAIEYAADAEEMIEYRGERDKLWKRPYGKLYEAMGLTLLHTGDATGFDRCTYWLLEKP
jgi:pseudaminic acid biosynthesis-associated methylase